MSIERIDNERGRGIGSDPDANYCIICLMLARRFLAASTVGIADHFPDALPGIPANIFLKKTIVVLVDNTLLCCYYFQHECQTDAQ